MAKCKICGAPHTACGPRTTVIPVDQRLETRNQHVAPLKRYEVKREGRRGVVTTAVIKLTEDEAKRIGAKEVGVKSTTEKPAAKAAATPRNKARGASTKARTAAKDKPAAPADEKPAAPAGDK